MAQHDMTQMPNQLHQPLQDLCSRIDDLASSYVRDDGSIEDVINRNGLRNDLQQALIDYTIAILQVAERSRP